MKKLTKILIVIAMLALLIASFATVVGAEEEKKPGSVATINAKIAAIEAELAKPDSDENKNPKSKVTAAYEYIRDPDLVWDGISDTAEYLEAVAKVDGYCVQVATAICNKFSEVTADNVTPATAAINEAYAFVVACAPAETTAGYAEFKANVTTKNDAIVELKYAAVKMPEAGSETLYTQMNSARVAVRDLFKQIKKCPWVSDELYTKYSMMAYDLTTFMLDEYEAFLEIATTSDADYFKTVNDIRTVEAFVEATDISKADGYAATIDRLKAGLKIANDAVDAKRKSLDELAPFEEYDLGYYLQKYFNGQLTAEEYAALSNDEKIAYDNDNGHLPYPNAQGGHKTERVFEELYGSGENGYLKFMYGSDSIHHYTYFELNKASGKEEYGFVFEWDIRINEVVNSITLQDLDTVRKEGGYSVFATLFSYISGSDNFVSVINGSNDAKQTQYSIVKGYARTEYKEAMVTDVWTHCTLTYNPETKMGELYINYVKVLDLYHFGPEKTTTQIRFGPSNLSNWEGWDIDNIEIYYGTEFRITDKFSKMTPDEQFKYFVDYAYDGMGNKEEYLARNNAYNKAKVLLSKYPASNPSVVKFKEIDYDNDIKYPAMEQNLGILTEKVNNLKDNIAVTTENITKISDAIAEINSFVSKNAALIDKADTKAGGYQDQMKIVYSTEANLKKLEILNKFVDALVKFERATTLSALTRYAAKAAEIYAEAEYEIEENRLFVANDPVVIDFEKLLNGQKLEDGTYIKPTDDKGNPTPGYKDENDPTYIKIFEYYDSFASLLSAREKLENAKNIINAMNAVTDMDGYEATDAFFEANYEEIKSYTLLVRSYINSNNYDAEYPGVAEAIEKFNEMDPYFYEQLQLEHIEILTEMVAKYHTVNTLVEKVAVVNSVKAYFENEDTALNNTTISKAVSMRVEDEREALLKLQSQNDVYEYELLGYDEAYLDVLTQQTEYFINIINHMDSVIVFSEIEDLFEDASVYYYGINLHVEGALEAAEKYAEYREYIASVNANNAAFSMYMKDLDYALNCEGVEKRDETFLALKNLSTYVDFVDEGNKNIARQLETYNKELAAYEKTITAVESAIYESVQFGNALRTIKLPATVLSVIGRLTNN